MKKDLEQISRMSGRQIYWQFRDRIRDKFGRYLRKVGFKSNPPRVLVSPEKAAGVLEALGSMYALPFVELRAELESRFGRGCSATRSVVADAETILDGRIILWGDVGVEFSPWDQNCWSPRSLGIEAVHSVQRFYFLGKLGLAYMATGKKEFLNFGIESVDAWLDLNSSVRRPPWGSMNLSERIPQWLIFMFSAGDCLDNDRTARWLSSILSQSLVLSRNPEFASSNNHLLFNARTLLMVDYLFSDCFPEASRFSSQAHQILGTEIARQFGSDGAHLESCGGYQLWTTQCMCECVHLASRSGNDAEPLRRYRETLSRALAVLKSLEMPDGSPVPVGDYKDCDTPYSVADTLQAGIRLLGGSPSYVPSGHPTAWSLFWGGNSTVAEDTSADRETGSSTVYIPSTGYSVWKKGRDESTSYLMMKAGPISALDRNPGHGHADVLSVVLWLDGFPVIVDSGTYTYEPGEERRYFRGVSAHNTIQIGAQDQAVFWSAFRVAFMPSVSSSGINGSGTGGFSTAATVDLKVPGEVKGARHARRIFSADGKCLLIEDSVSCSKRLPLVSRYHLHPMWQVDRTGDETVLTSSASVDYPVVVLLKTFGRRNGEWNPVTTRVVESHYSPTYGVMIPNRCLSQDCEADDRGEMDLLTVITILGEHAADEVGITFDKGEVTVSKPGGDIIATMRLDD